MRCTERSRSMLAYPDKYASYTPYKTCQSCNTCLVYTERSRSISADFCRLTSFSAAVTSNHASAIAQHIALSPANGYSPLFNFILLCSWRLRRSGTTPRVRDLHPLEKICAHLLGQVNKFAYLHLKTSLHKCALLLMQGAHKSYTTIRAAQLAENFVTFWKPAKSLIWLL